MAIATANGKKFTFPDGTTPEQMGQAIDEYFAANPVAPQKEDGGILDTAREIGSTALNTAGDFASAVNRSVVDGVDFFTTDLVNNTLQLAGSDKRIPTFRQGADAIGATQGNNLEPGLLKDIAETAGETVAIGASVGSAVRGAASKLPAIQEGTESVAKGVLRQFGGGSATDDAATAALSAVGAEAGEEVGGDTGRLVGAVAAPLSPAAAKGAISQGRAMFQQAAANKAIKESAPDIDTLKTSARKIYKQVDDLGVTVKQVPLSRLSDSISATIKREGFNARIHPKVSAALDEIAELTQESMSVSEIDTMRKVARSAARSIDPDEARLGSMMVEKIDNFLDAVPRSAITGEQADKVSPLLKEARGFWGRAKKSEILEDAFERAHNQASGFENGLRTQFRSILNNKKKLRGFSQEEIRAMQQVVRGGKAENVAKALGKFGFTEGQATSMLLGSLGVAGGVAVGGATGGVAIPLLGQAAKKAASTLTNQNASLAQAITKSGGNGRQIVAAYIKNVPKNKRNAEELVGLLLQNKAPVDELMKSSNKLIANAAYFASVLGSAAVVPVDQSDNEVFK